MSRSPGHFAALSGCFHEAGWLFAVCAGVLVFTLLLPPSAAATWPTDPLVSVPLCTASDSQSNPTSVSDGVGGAIVTWQDSRSGLDSDIYAQRISAAGTVQWTADGVALCTEASSQMLPTIVADGAGGAIVTWSDLRNGSTDVYAQRISAAGTVQWTADGVAICAAANEQYVPTITEDNAGGAIVAWLDYRLGFLDEAAIYAQRISAAGTVQWTADGVALCSSTSDKGYPAIAPDGAGGAIVTWCSWPNSIDSDIYAQRILAAGTVQWTVAGVALCAAASSQELPTIAPDGAGGAIVTWYDYRGGYHYDIYAQRIATGGAVQWTADGEPICTADFAQGYPAIVSDGAGGAIVTWQDSRYGYSTDIFAQRISAGGAVQWQANGLALTVGIGEQGHPTIAADGAGGAIIAWSDSRNGSQLDVYAQRISSGGAEQWAANGVAVCTATGLQDFPRIVTTGGGGAIVTWHDTRSGTPDIYAQGIDNMGGFFYMPTIMSIRDLSGDQGGKVRVAWSRSTLDAKPALEISLYGIWRETSASEAQAALAGGARLTDESKQAPLPQPAVFRATVNGAAIQYWEGVGTVAARGEPIYTFVSPTLQDSSGAGSAYTVFMVDAHLAFRPGFFDSAPDSGYSVDNLAPAQPSPFSGKYLVSATALHWGRSPAADLSGYQLYRGDSGDFIPGPTNFVVSKPDTGYVDHVAGVHYYKLCAADIHGNLSSYALLTPQLTTPVPGSTLATLRLYPNAPNPFNPRTTIRFDLPVAGAVRLAVYDVAGRLIRVLVVGELPGGSHEAVWDGCDSTGRSAPSGSYLARLVAGGKVEGVRLSLVR
jgi:hypothetical protein